MEAMEELQQLSEAMLQASAVLADEDVDEPSKRTSTFLNVVALGNVGAGKSAVLNSLIGHPVLPTGENGATRAPICVDLQRDASLNSKSIVLQIDSKTQQVSASALRHSLQDRLSKGAGVNSSGRSRPDEIYLKLLTSTAPPLKLIDLPGVDQRAADESMITYYGANNDAIILVVIPASQASEVASSRALRIAKEFDSDGTRTIGIISKIDQAASDQKNLAVVQDLLNQRSRAAADVPWVALIGQSVSIASAQAGSVGSENSLETAWRAESESLKSILTGAPQSKLGRIALVETLAKQIRNRMKTRLPSLLSGETILPESPMAKFLGIFKFHGNAAGHVQNPELRNMTEREQSGHLEDDPLDQKHETGMLKSVVEDLKVEISAAREQQNAMCSQLEEAHRQVALLTRQVADSEATVTDLKEQLHIERSNLCSMQAENNRLRHELDYAVAEANELRDQVGNKSCSCCEFTSLFSVEELKEATQDFSDDSKIGEGGFGCVYRGSIRNTPVAIKVLSSDSLQGKVQFQHEVSILSKVRHPNLVTLIGACLETCSLVYEFLPNGNLDDLLEHPSNKLSLTWQIRTQIIGEICSALIFLHNHKPHPVVHGDFKPANILLDENLRSKLSDFGISRLLEQSNMNSTLIYYTQNPTGTFAYMDPEFLTTGGLTTQSDIYALGITILRLLTGKSPFGIAKLVKEAFEKDDLKSVIDGSAGEWPALQAKQLARIGLRCADAARKNRPDLENEVWRVVGPLMKSAALFTAQNNLASSSDDNMPPYFVCPILQEIMRDPHIAADGFTYEAAAIRSWLEMGRDTSPMTNELLLHKDLIPNHALRSAIKEYLRLHPLQT